MGLLPCSIHRRVTYPLNFDASLADFIKDKIRQPWDEKTAGRFSPAPLSKPRESSKEFCLSFDGAGHSVGSGGIFFGDVGTDALQIFNGVW